MGRGCRTPDGGKTYEHCNDQFLVILYLILNQWTGRCTTARDMVDNDNIKTKSTITWLVHKIIHNDRLQITRLSLTAFEKSRFQ
uniref:Uncharacterized protein n=1 Tax=Romanomermis culicivorax TaxID=13658 RepID=A0A915I0W1_ROMCU